MNIVSAESIASKIHVFKEKKVMLDSDLALLYGVKTKELNKAVKRNLNRFPDDFMFQLNQSETTNLRFQIGTSSLGYGGKRYKPYVFTEQGIAMLSSILRSERAVQVNILIMRTFSKIREMIVDNAGLRNKLEELEEKYDGQFDEVFTAIGNLIEDKRNKRPIGFKTKE